MLSLQNSVFSPQVLKLPKFWVKKTEYRRLNKVPLRATNNAHFRSYQQVFAILGPKYLRTSLCIPVELEVVGEQLETIDP